MRLARLSWTACREARLATLALALTMLLLSLPSAQPAPPVISFIDRFLTNQVLIHFDTDANRTYTLQYTDKIGTNGFASSTWSNLATYPSQPGPDHYIVPDWGTNKMRFYRLKVTP